MSAADDLGRRARVVISLAIDDLYRDLADLLEEGDAITAIMQELSSETFGIVDGFADYCFDNDVLDDDGRAKP